MKCENLHTLEEIRDTTKNKYLKNLCTYLINKNISKEQIIEWTNLSARTLFSLDYFPAKSTNQKPFTKAFIGKLYLTCGIHPKEFFLDTDKEYESAIKEKRETKEYIWLKKFAKTDETKQKYVTRTYWNTVEKYRPFTKNTLLEVIPIAADDNPNQTLTNTYDKIKNYFLEAENRILVHELTFKGNNIRTRKQKTYHAAQEKVLNSIQKALKNAETERAKPDNTKPDFEYIRVLNLSKSWKVFEKSNNTLQRIAAIGEASKETLSHIKWCFDQKFKHVKCSFFISPHSRFRHHAIIDKKYFLIEDYIYKPSENALVPDSFYIDIITKPSPIDIFINGFEQYLNDKETENYLVKGDIKSNLSDTIEYITNKFEEKRNLIKSINDAFIGKSRPKNVEKFIRKERERLTILGDIIHQLKNKKEQVLKKI